MRDLRFFIQKYTVRVTNYELKYAVFRGRDTIHVEDGFTARLIDLICIHMCLNLNSIVHAAQCENLMRRQCY